MLSADIARALKDLARREGVTLYMTLLAALDVLLHRYTGQDDIVVGTSISNRGHADTERMIGFFINALVLRTELSSELSFVELLGRVRDVCLGAYAHQDMPFERLVQELQPEPDPSRSPLFQVIFTMQNAPVDAVDLGGLELRPVKAASATVKFDLTFVMGEIPSGLGVSIEYNADLFDAATIERMLGHLGALLESAAKAPSSRLGISRCCARKSGSGSSAPGTTPPRRSPPTRRSTSSSRPRSTRRPIGSPSSPAPIGSRSASSITAPTSSRTTCAGSASGPSRWSASRSRARRG